METYTELTMRDYLRVLFRQKAVLITAFVTVMVTVVTGLMLKTDVYEAKVKMLISGSKQVESPYYRDLAMMQNIQLTLTQSEIVTSKPVIERVVGTVGLYNRPLDYEKNFASFLKKPFVKMSARSINKRLASLTEDQKKSALARFAIDDLTAKIKVEPIRDTNLFSITVSDFSPVYAMLLANIVSRSYIIFDLEQQVAELQLKYGEKHPMVIQLNDSIKNMIKNMTGEPLQNIEAIGPATVKVIEQATVPLRPSGPSKLMVLALAFFMSIFLGVMLAFAFEYMDQTFKTPQELEAFLNLPFLGSVPKNAKVTSYHNVADQINMILKDTDTKALLCAGPTQGEGTSTIVAQLGMYLTKTAGKKVLIIDANLRHPSIHKELKISDTHGLADVLEGRLTLDKVLKDLGNHLNVLPAGQTVLNPITLINSNAMHEIITHAKEKYEIVLIDCPALIEHKDAAVLSAYVDGVLLVVSEGKTRRQVVKAGFETLAQNKASIIGAILTNRTFPIPEKLYRRI